MPDDVCRMRDDEIKGEEEYNAELRRKAGHVDDLPFENDGPQFGFNDQSQ